MTKACACLLAILAPLTVVTTGSNYRLVMHSVGAATMDINKAPIGSVISVGGMNYVKVNTRNVLVAAGSFTSQQDQYALKHYQVYGCQNPTGVLQSWNSCSSLATPVVGTWTQGPCLIDRRDGKTYEIRKYADGHCWMVDNLAYGGDTLWGGKDGCVAHPHADTLFGCQNTVENFFQSDGTTINYLDYEWNSDGTGKSSNFGTGRVLRGTFGEGTYGNCALAYDNDTWRPYEVFQSNGYSLANTSEYDTYEEALAAADGEINLVRPRGYHYDWVAAMQNPTAYWQESGDDPYIPLDSTQGICPEGWRLPTGGTSADTEIKTMYTSVGSSRANLIKNWKAPTAGYADKVLSFLGNQTTDGGCFSSTSKNSIHAYRLVFGTGTSVFLDSISAAKNAGIPVRCIKD